MTVEPRLLIERIRRAVSTSGKLELDHSTLAYVTSGLENHLFRVRSQTGHDIALRIPIERYIKNDNDQGIDSRALLKQEYDLLQHLWQAGLPVPQPIDLYFDDSGHCVDYLAAVFIQGDGAIVLENEIGRVVRQLHVIPPPAFIPVAQRLDTLEETLADLILRRSEVIERMSGRFLAIPSRETLALCLHWSPRRRSLLHMDVRQDNIIGVNGRVLALIDWSNVLVGPPALELCRVAEYGLLSPAFRRGYGDDPLENTPSRVLLAYRLYTATMLAVVFLSEAPDPVRAAKAVDRVGELYEQLRELT